MTINDDLTDRDEQDDPFQALERDDDPIVWETNESLQREQFLQVVRRQDELERERIADFAEADYALLELLQQYRYNDKGFMERLDPQLVGALGEDEYGVDPEDFGDDSPAHPFADGETEDENEDEEDSETDKVPGPSTDSSTLKFKVYVLERLAALRRSGDLTENEFKSLKVELFREQE
jgi:hypothetical protein